MELLRTLRSTAGRPWAIGASALAAAVCLLTITATSREPASGLTALPTTSAAPRPTVAPAATPDPGLTMEPTDVPREENDGTGNTQLMLSSPAPGTGEWEYASGSGPRAGWAGSVRPYRVAVEVGVPVSVASFAAAVDAALGDYRGWTAAGQVQFRRVPRTSGANFTVFLASPWTAYDLCRSVVDIRIGGVPYSSCQAGAQVVINSDRYLSGSADRFTGPLSVYRPYVINHEVGHRLGYGHQHCGGAGQLAPVMQQQTLRMEGCQPNAWPYPYAPAPSPTTTPAPTPAPSPTPTPSPTASPTPTPTATPTPTSTATPEPSATVTTEPDAAPTTGTGGSP